MTDPEQIERIAEGPCPKCDDSGFEETALGGFWAGESMRSVLTICDCICGDDVRRERAHRHHLETTNVG